MRHFWTTLVLIAALATGCWLLFFRVACDPKAHAAAQAGNVMEWMRCEFRLTEAQYAAIGKLHAEHAAVCAGHCTAVETARAKVAAARGTGDAAQVAAAQREQREAENVCRVSVEAHVRRVAAVMDPAAGERYLKMVLPRLAALDHAGPPSLSLEH
jgi:hypothetical protein